MKHLLCIVGTRPEAIKMASVIYELRALNTFHLTVVSTGQHLEMLDQALKSFEIVPDVRLAVMSENQDLTALSSKLMLELGRLFTDLKPDVVLVQGDTTSVMIASLAAAYKGIKIAHIEAGLRTRDFENPFPEEINRVVVGSLASWHFAPTENAKQNLIKEGISANDILVCGNTSIDALWLAKGDLSDLEIDTAKRLIVITAHRRENLGDSLVSICSAILKLSERHKDVCFVFPVHLNPKVRLTVFSMLSGVENIFLCDPLNYSSFVELMKKSYLILTDSGGIQEEATALKKPVLILRDQTERPEGVSAGMAKLIGTSCQKIVSEVDRLLLDDLEYMSMRQGQSPYGVGDSGKRIAGFLKNRLYCE